LTQRVNGVFTVPMTNSDLASRTYISSISVQCSCGAMHFDGYGTGRCGGCSTHAEKRAALVEQGISNLCDPATCESCRADAEAVAA
jgi:hypothetical protein